MRSMTKNTLEASIVGSKEPKWVDCASKTLHDLWLITKDDVPTFVLPNTAFGVCSALAGSRLLSHPTSPSAVLCQIPAVLIFNWTNLLVFDLANQRLPKSIKEDSLNKPWRPLPSGRMTQADARLAMIITIPSVIAFNSIVLDTGTESAIICSGTWVYNDLEGGEHWIFRNILCAVAFAVFNKASTKVAAGTSTMFTMSPNFQARHVSGSGPILTGEGYAWLVTISCVILTTMHIQDLKDQEGDRARGRLTVPLALGDANSRWSIAIPILLWTGSIILYWQPNPALALSTATLALYVVWRCLRLRDSRSDRRTWQLWTLWTALLYAIPFSV